MQKKVRFLKALHKKQKVKIEVNVKQTLNITSQ